MFEEFSMFLAVLSLVAKRYVPQLQQLLLICHLFVYVQPIKQAEARVICQFSRLAVGRLSLKEGMANREMGNRKIGGLGNGETGNRGIGE